MGHHIDFCFSRLRFVLLGPIVHVGLLERSGHSFLCIFSSVGDWGMGTFQRLPLKPHGALHAGQEWNRQSAGLVFFIIVAGLSVVRSIQYHFYLAFYSSTARVKQSPSYHAHACVGLMHWTRLLTCKETGSIHCLLHAAQFTSSICNTPPQHHHFRRESNQSTCAPNCRHAHGALARSVPILQPLRNIPTESGRSERQKIH